MNFLCVRLKVKMQYTLMFVKNKIQKVNPDDEIKKPSVNGGFEQG